MKRREEIGGRPVRTVYYHLREAVKITASGKPLNAAANCLRYLRKNTYEATHAEVYSTTTGKLYAVMKRDMHGNVHTLFENKPTKEELES
jgi:hypothetical protein